MLFDLYYWHVSSRGEESCVPLPRAGQESADSAELSPPAPHRPPPLPPSTVASSAPETYLPAAQ